MHSSSSVFFFLFSLLLLVQLSVGSKYYEVVDSAVSFSPDERGGVGTSCYLSNSQFRQCFGVTESGRRSGELSCNFEVSNGRSCAQEGKNGKSCQSSCANGECLPCPSPSSQEGHGEGEGEDSGSQTEGCPSCVSPCEGAVCDCGLTTCNPENATYCDPCGTMGQLACSTCDDGTVPAACESPLEPCHIAPWTSVCLVPGGGQCSSHSDCCSGVCCNGFCQRSWSRLAVAYDTCCNKLQ